MAPPRLKPLSPRCHSINLMRLKQSLENKYIDRGFYCDLHLAGFTLLEIVISIGVMTLLITIGTISLMNSRNTKDLVSSAHGVVSVLRLAQSKSLAGEDASTWGVRFDQGGSQYIIFRGPTWAGSTSTQSHILPSSIEISSMGLFGGGQEVVFKKINGETDQFGTVTLRIKSSGDTITTVIDPSGQIHRSGSTLSPVGTRIIDTRHRSFNLGWSIQSYSTTTLIFSDPPNPDITYVMSMLPYFNAQKTKFDWTGTLNVGNSSQILRLHTTFLDSANTIFSVDRDCRTNSKRVQIRIGSRDIATYEADCITINLGVFGGTMNEP